MGPAAQETARKIEEEFYRIGETRSGLAFMRTSPAGDLGEGEPGPAAFPAQRGGDEFQRRPRRSRSRNRSRSRTRSTGVRYISRRFVLTNNRVSVHNKLREFDIQNSIAWHLA